MVFIERMTCWYIIIFLVKAEMSAFSAAARNEIDVSAEWHDSFIMLCERQKAILNSADSNEKNFCKFFAMLGLLPY